MPLSDLHPFEGHPFTVLDDELMEQTVESIKQIGVVSPLIVRPDPEGGYEILSGHRRLHAAQLAGLETVPVIVIAPSDELFDKTASNVQEVVARGGRVVFFGDAAGINGLGDIAATCIALPAVDPFVAPILYAIPVQLLAYHVAVLKGTDVDQPRNLAKSVTVE